MFTEVINEERRKFVFLYGKYASNPFYSLYVDMAVWELALSDSTTSSPLIQPLSLTFSSTLHASAFSRSAWHIISTWWNRKFGPQFLVSFFFFRTWAVQCPKDFNITHKAWQFSFSFGSTIKMSFLWITCVSWVSADLRQGQSFVPDVWGQNAITNSNVLLRNKLCPCTFTNTPDGTARHHKRSSESKTGVFLI